VQTKLIVLADRNQSSGPLHVERADIGARENMDGNAALVARGLDDVDEGRALSRVDRLRNHDVNDMSGKEVSVCV
jgi:hypothetical protein